MMCHKWMIIFTINQTVDFMNENRKYTSVFAPYLERFVAMKDAGGLSPRSGLYDALRLLTDSPLRKVSLM